ncbi:MAG: hypothetical protein JJV92_06355 [Desulfosarcina sp.]|nr:hypothetical protein [Desulfobacterales bacterium]
MKKIVFIHYHLRTGGVTTVLRQQIEALKDVSKVLLLTGEPPKISFPVEVVHIPELGYCDGSSDHDFKPEEAAESVIKAVQYKFKGKCDLIHVHNPVLAKNVHFLSILRLLQKDGIRLFLQIHDFAEDGRPLFYYKQDEYPADAHYGVINSRDYEILSGAGLKKEGLHLIPNIVDWFGGCRPEVATSNIALYPVRAIRRKNIGEAILLSIFFKHNETLAVTLPPSSPLDVESYSGWKDFVRDNRLNVEFEAGLQKSFPELVQSARFIITTSINEGFGFSFLEPWMSKKVVWGRKLPGICDGFEDNGIDLGHLYTRLYVPVNWIGRENLYRRFKSAMKKNINIYKSGIYNEKVAESCKKIVENENIDFGLLDESFQKDIIRRVLSDRKDAERLLLLNPYMAIPGDLPDDKRLLKNNLEVVKGSYNMALYQANLLKIYSTVVKSRVRHKIKRDLLLESFLNPEDLSLLKWGDYVE